MNPNGNGNKPMTGWVTRKDGTRFPTGKGWLRHSDGSLTPIDLRTFSGSSAGAGVATSLAAFVRECNPESVSPRPSTAP